MPHTEYIYHVRRQTARALCLHFDNAFTMISISNPVRRSRFMQLQINHLVGLKINYYPGSDCCNTVTASYDNDSVLTRESLWEWINQFMVGLWPQAQFDTARPSRTFNTSKIDPTMVILIIYGFRRHTLWVDFSW